MDDPNPAITRAVPTLSESASVFEATASTYKGCISPRRKASTLQHAHNVIPSRFGLFTLYGHSGAASTSFPLRIPSRIEAALNPYLHPPTLEMTSICNYTTSMLKRFEPNTELAVNLVVMVKTTSVSTNRFEGKDRNTDTTATDPDRKLQDALPVSQKVYLGSDQPDGCPEDLDTPHCNECGGNKGSFVGVSGCRGIADKDMRWADCICVDMDFSHSDPLIRPRRGERMMSPYCLETVRLIEEYGLEEEDEPIDLDADSTEVGDADRTISQAGSGQGHECNSAIEYQ